MSCEQHSGTVSTVLGREGFSVKLDLAHRLESGIGLAEWNARQEGIKARKIFKYQEIKKIKKIFHDAAHIISQDKTD